MSKVWVSPKCPLCRKNVEGGGILVAQVTTTPKDTYQCYKSRKNDVRPLFGGPKAYKRRALYHPECLEGTGFTPPDAP